MARVRLTNNSLNSYGTRVLTAGIDTSNFDKNPVLLYMHNRGTVIGIVKNIERNDDEITAELEFDEATELSRQCKKQFEFGSLRMVSIGIDVLEMSDAPELIVPGQRYATVTKSQLYEVSLVDIGANHDAVVLRYNGNTLNLADGGNLPLMALNTKINMENCIETKMLCEKLGLAEGSSNEAILEKIESLKADAETANAQLEAMNEKMFASAIETAIADGRITADKKDHFMKLAIECGYEFLKETLEACQPRQTLASQLEPDKGEPAMTVAHYDRMDRDGSLLAFKKANPEKFAELYKLKFGK